MQLLNRDQVLEYFVKIRSGCFVKINDGDYKKVYVVATVFTETYDEYTVVFTDLSNMTMKYNDKAKVFVDDSGLCLTEIRDGAESTIKIKE